MRMASMRKSEAIEQTLQRREQNRTCMDSMRESETIEQNLAEKRARQNAQS